MCKMCWACTYLITTRETASFHLSVILSQTHTDRSVIRSVLKWPEAIIKNRVNGAGGLRQTGYDDSVMTQQPNASARTNGDAPPHSWHRLRSFGCS